jgi:alpha-beta hydrolase superfamily lysophospholipase
VERLLSDLKEITTHLSIDHSGKPLVLAAISWGAKGALAYWEEAARNPYWWNPYERLLLITPGLFRRVHFPFSRKMLAGLSAVFNPLRSFEIPIPTTSFTQESDKLQFLENDTHRLREVTARFLKVDFELDQEMKNLRGIYPQPVRLFQAGIERIVDNEKTFEFLNRHFFDVKKVEYPQAFHTLEFERGISYREDLAAAAGLVY